MSYTIICLDDKERVRLFDATVRSYAEALIIVEGFIQKLRKEYTGFQYRMIPMGVIVTDDVGRTWRFITTPTPTKEYTEETNWL